MRGDTVHFVCADDTHGTPIMLAAEKAGVTPEAFIAGIQASHERDFAAFGVAFDHYDSTNSAANRELTEQFYQRLDAGGHISRRTVAQFYDPAKGMFLPDRYITGTCPNCGYDAARGDQCENCTKQLDPTDLINPRSSISGSTNLEVRETKHLYLRQRALKDKLEAWIDSKTDWPILTTSIAKKWLNDGDGLQDRGITRDLYWGIPVKKGSEDWPGMEGKVFYVWFDAPIEYIAGTAEWADANGLDDAAWERWWRTDKGASTSPITSSWARTTSPSTPCPSPPPSSARANRGSWSITSSPSIT